MENDNLLTKNSYVSFDATSLRDLIINRLNQGQVFTDQNYQGSNLSALIDVISFSFSTLLFYLNKTSSESMYSESQIYENMNRMVKILNYNPVGRLGQSVPFMLNTSSNLPIKNYIIPRFSYMAVGGSYYSFNTDIKFYKPSQGEVNITDVSNKYLLYQGLFQEYPTQNAIGIENETIYLTLNDSVYIDHFNIFVFVKQVDRETWEEWDRVPETFLYGPNDPIFQVRFNENKRYEIKFGDDINGKRLREGDQIAIYYLNIDKNVSNLGPGALNSTKVATFNSLRFAEIYSDVTVNTLGEKLTPDTLQYIQPQNEHPSTFYSDEESVDDIRKNASKNFRSQYRLVTTNDYESFIKTNYSNLLTDVRVVNNDDYLRGHVKYLYDIGLDKPQNDNQILINQIKFANSCNFNNLYVYLVPKNNYQNYIVPAQKELILNGLQPNKTLTSQIVPMDPVYIYMDFYVEKFNSDPSPNDLTSSYLAITKEINSRRSNSAILSDIEKVIKDLFSRKQNKLGQLIDIYQLATTILNIDGVKKIQTYREDDDIYVEGISLLLWNYYYPLADSEVYTQNIQLENFKYPIFNNIDNISSKIKIIEPTGSIKISDF
jgi:hypothetical protein